MSAMPNNIMVIARHADGLICPTATSTHDCPRSHDYEHRPAPVGMRPALVSFDFDDNLAQYAIPCWLRTDGLRWNGWQMPTFDLDILQAHRASLQALFPMDYPDTSLAIVWAADGTLTLVDPQEPDYDFNNVDADGRYSLGAASLTWIEVAARD